MNLSGGLFMANPISSPLILQIFTLDETNLIGQKLQSVAAGPLGGTWVGDPCLRHWSGSRPEQHIDKQSLTFFSKVHVLFWFEPFLDMLTRALRWEII